MAKATRWVYFFGDGKADGRGDQKELLGGKGAGLAEMTRIGLPVPPGFTITTEACAHAQRRGGAWATGLEKQIRQALAKLERSAKRKLGAGRNPLLVSVRSGAARSMPGMMETILNLGLNDQSVEGLAVASGNRRFAFDAYRRLIMMYGSIAADIDRARFDEAFEELKNTRTRARLGRGCDETIVDTDANEEELESLVVRFKDIYREGTGSDFPQNPFDQLRGAINAVFRSWMAEKAVTYRRVERMTGLTGTAVNVCQMVFGNMGSDSGTGVCFTRDPSTGDPHYYGDLLVNAQGEDVVAGIRTPLKLAELQTLMPEVYEQLEAVRVILELHYKDMQDLEFTFERGKLYMLQCRVGKRSPVAAFKIAVDQATKGLLSSADAKRLVKKKLLSKKLATAATKPVITKDEAIGRIGAADIERLFYPVLDPAVSQDDLASRRLGEGIGAVPGAACGEIAFTAEDAEMRAAEGKTVILVRQETSPEDVGGMFAAAGILTATGGKTSHAAVVARGWGKCCIVGCDALRIDHDAQSLLLNGSTLHDGDAITLDGATGAVYEGTIDLIRPEAPPEFDTLMSWCDRRRRMKVRTNADTPADAKRAVELGAEGIGLCRTEHMFFDASQPQRIIAMREMILADSEEGRRRALAKLLPFQREDFEGIFEAMNGKPVTIRLLDPPLHEFLPQHDNVEGQEAVAAALNETGDGSVTLEDVQRRVDQLHEANPMLGHRGCRLCITYPEILEMQVRAIMEAAVECSGRGVKVLPEIMIPLTIEPREMAVLAKRTRTAADAVLAERKAKVAYLVGTMIETPRAAIMAGPMADVSQFFSFGTNDLTQMTMGLSRDDAGRFLPDYLRAGCAEAGLEDGERSRAGSATCEPCSGAAILPHDPFQSLDVDGVGALVCVAVENGRAARPKIKLGVCGEHGGDPKSIAFFDQVGLEYVSCSPLRVPVARWAAAQATISDHPRPGIVKAKAKPKNDVKPRKTKSVRSAKSAKKASAKRKTAKRSRR